jgi:hypothetical protein
MSMRRLSPRRALAVVTLIELVVLYMVLKESSWAYDDNFFLVLAGQEGFTWHWLMSVKFEHWDIAMNAAYSLQHFIFFFDYRWALVLMLGLLGGSIYLFERVLATIVRNRWVTIAVAAWFGLNILWVRPLQWWAAGVQYFPYTFFDLLCLYAFLRYHADGQRRWIAISGGALAVALLFYEKPAYMLLYLVLLRVLLMSKDLSPRSVLADFWRERAIWLVYLAVILVWGLGYINSNAYSSHGGVTVAQYFGFFRILWFQTLVPSLASVTIPASNLNSLQIVFVAISQFVVVAFIVVSLIYRRSSWRAWAFLAIIIFLSGVLVAHSRVQIFGVDIANDPRYLIDYAWLVPLALCAAFVPGGLVRPKKPGASPRSAMSSRGRLVPVAPIVTIVLLAYAGASVATALQVQKNWAGPQAREWEKRVRSGIAALERHGQRPMVADNATPPEIIASWLAPYDRLSRILPLYVGPIQVDGPLDAPLVQIASDGTVHRATVVDAGPARTPLGSAEAHVIHVASGARTAHVGKDLCVIADGSPVSIQRELDLTSGAPAEPYYVDLGYRVWGTTTLPIFVDTGTGYPAVADASISLVPNGNASIAWLGVPGVPRSVELMIPPLTTVCVSQFQIATLRSAR